MDTVSSILRHIAVFIITATILILLYLLVALIPRAKIQNNMEESAKYLQKIGAAFPRTTVGINCSRADYYADAVLLNVAYYLDQEHPAESISWARFYSEDAHDWNGMVTDYLPVAVEKQPDANQQYLRYWHGSLTIVRPLLISFNLDEIYRILGVVLWTMLGSIIVLLIRKRFVKEAVAFALSMIGVSVWYVPVCLEYLWMFLLMTSTSLIAIILALKKQYYRMPGIFLSIGMVAAFLDFFTTETITLLIPLMFMFMIWHKQKGGSPDWGVALKSAALWGIGYVAMWTAKWGFAAIALKTNVMPYVQSSIAEHLGVMDRTPLQLLWMRSIRRNISNLFTFNYGIIGAILTLLLFFCLVFLPICFNRISLKEKIQKKWVLFYLMIAAIPFLRFVVIPEHSAVHAWFTYRALAASIMAFILLFYELVDFNFKRNYLGEK